MAQWHSALRYNLVSAPIARLRYLHILLFFLRFYLFTFERGEEREKERERNISVWLPLMCSLLGTWPTTQACALTGNRTGDPLVHRPALNPLSHTSQGYLHTLVIYLLYFLEYSKWTYYKPTFAHPCVNIQYIQIT